MQTTPISTVVSRANKKRRVVVVLQGRAHCGSGWGQRGFMCDVWTNIKVLEVNQGA